jgi:hypothetical protein
LRDIAAQPDMPTVDTLKDWLAKNPDFRAEFDAARQFQSEIFADDVVALANALAQFDVAGLKLRIDALKWRSSVLRKNGEKGGVDLAALDAEMIARLEAGLQRATAMGVEDAERASTSEPDDGVESDSTGSEPSARVEEGE